MMRDHISGLFSKQNKHPFTRASARPILVLAMWDQEILSQYPRVQSLIAQDHHEGGDIEGANESRATYHFFEMIPHHHQFSSPHFEVQFIGYNTKNNWGHIRAFEGFVLWIWREGTKKDCWCLGENASFSFFSPSPEPEVLFQWNKVIWNAQDIIFIEDGLTRWEKSILWTALESARRCFESQKVKTNHPSDW